MVKLTIKNSKGAEGFILVIGWPKMLVQGVVNVYTYNMWK